jgi:DNA-binding transcriptional ArsR family regulator
VDALAALADDTRRQIVALLAGGERAARVLREAGLVQVRTQGQRRVYTLDPRPLAELDAWLTPYRRLWAQRLDALDTEIARGRRARAPEDGR